MFDLFATNTLDIAEVPAGSHVYLAVLHDQLKDASAGYKVSFEVSR